MQVLLKFKKENIKTYDLLDKFSSDNKILMALKYGAMGDAMANLKQIRRCTFYDG